MAVAAARGAGVAWPGVSSWHASTLAAARPKINPVGKLLTVCLASLPFAVNGYLGLRLLARPRQWQAAHGTARNVTTRVGEQRQFIEWPLATVRVYLPHD